MIIPPHRRQERGQTIILVAVALVSLLAMAALAIDVVTLYVARSEIQRAADAAALAGAKGIADSGVTTLQSGDTNLPAAETLAESMANSEVNAFLSVNSVAGGTPSLALSSPSFDWTHNNNPRITVTLQVTNLPTFFARILGRRTAAVTASATAEAYNPANMATITPIAPKGVKPWLVANKDPYTGNQFVDPAVGTVEAGVIGEQLDLVSDCEASGCPKDNPPKILPGQRVEYLPAQVSSNTSSYICPSSCTGTTDFERSIQCYDTNAYACGGPVGVSNAAWDNNINPAGVQTGLGAECLINATGGTGLNQGQDTLIYPTSYPNGPPEITAQSGTQSGKVVTTSSSIVTIPIIDTNSVLSSGVRIIGFLQGFINQVDTGLGVPLQNSINITVLNVAGCSSSSNGAPPVVGGMGTSPIPVRLITP